jgi:hypothetical protein
LGFNGQRVQTLIQEILERIIHKPMPCHERLPHKSHSSDAHPEMGAKTGAIGPRMTVVLVALVNYLQALGLQDFLQALLQQVRGGGLGHGAGVLGSSSAVR